MVLLPHLKGSKTMERSRTENRSAFAQAIKRRDGAMREMLGMESDSVGHGEGDNHHKPAAGYLPDDDLRGPKPLRWGSRTLHRLLAARWTNW